MPLRIFVIEDHPVMREMLCEFLTEKPEIDVCGSAETGAEALTVLSKTHADLVLVDVSLPEMNGFDVVRELQGKRPAVPCLMISGHGEPNYVQRAFGAGARGYILKGNPNEIFAAIQEVSGGGTYLSASLQMKHPRPNS